MSLNVSLVNENKEEFYWVNLTHNLAVTAKEVMIRERTLYDYLWQPDKMSIGKAHMLVTPLTSAIKTLRSDPDKFKKLNPTKGWGSYEDIVRLIEEYLQECKNNREAFVVVNK